MQAGCLMFNWLGNTQGSPASLLSQHYRKLLCADRPSTAQSRVRSLVMQSPLQS
jgi:hypothetical protein